MSTPLNIIHNPDASRFEATVEGLLCRADYELRNGVMAMTHTVVPSALEGRGIAGQLVKTALQWAKAEGWKVQPVCSYVEVYLRRHPEWNELRA